MRSVRRCSRPLSQEEVPRVLPQAVLPTQVNDEMATLGNRSIPSWSVATRGSILVSSKTHDLAIDGGQIETFSGSDHAVENGRRRQFGRRQF